MCTLVHEGWDLSALIVFAALLWFMISIFFKSAMGLAILSRLPTLALVVLLMAAAIPTLVFAPSYLSRTCHISTFGSSQQN